MLRQYLALIQATTRTNFLARDAAGAPRSFVSFKPDSGKVPACPSRASMFEIFVYSTRFEGVHLAAGAWPAAGCAGRPP